MTKKHFIALANALRSSKPQITQHGNSYADRLSQWEQDRNEIAKVCQKENFNFNRELWLDYIDGKCGPNG